MTADGEEDRHTARRLGFGAAVVIVLVAVAVTVGVGVLRSALAPVDAIPLPAETGVPIPTEGEGAPAAPASELVVHITGAVADPGVYILPEGARVLDAVAAAGGLTETAEPGSVNLARPLSDGEQLIIAEIGEDPPEQSSAATPGAPPETADGRVNLNTADEAALDTLPRIGPALAQRIIDWREENGPFTSVDDLLAVSGFGEKMVESLRDLVVW